MLWSVGLQRVGCDWSVPTSHHLWKKLLWVQPSWTTLEHSSLQEELAFPVGLFDLDKIQLATFPVIKEKGKDMTKKIK